MNEKEPLKKNKPAKRAFLLMGVVVALLLALIATVALAQGETQEESIVPGRDGVLGLRGPGLIGGFGHFGGDGDWLAYLAEALGITVDELEAAQEEAYAAAMADAVTAGEITQEQADEMLARRALSAYIEHDAILATALGMTVEDLESALAGGQSLGAIIAERGIDAATLQANAQAAYEAAVQQAVTDGVITQAQADELLSGGGLNPFGLGGGGHDWPGGRGGHGGRGGRGRGFDLAPDATTPEAAPETTDTGFDA